MRPHPSSSAPAPRRLPAVTALTAVVAAIAAIAAKPAAPSDPDCLRRLHGIDLQTATVVELQDAMEDGRLRSVDLVTRSLERIAAFDSELNAVRSLAPDVLGQASALDRERRRSGPRGLLHGVTVLLKDNVGTTDLPTTAGSIALEGNIPATEAVVTTRLREAGAIVLGKANLSEFANWVSLSMPNGYSSLGGQVVSPYRFGKDPLGSSTGSGVAAAMAYSTVTIGTETSGSIVSPAWVNGLAAIKPTHGSVSIAGIVPLAPSFDVAGPMGRSILDVAATLQVIDEADVDLVGGLSTTSLEGARIGVREQDVEPLLGTFPDERQLFLDALDELEAQGAEVVVIDEPVPTLASGSLLELAAIFNEFKVGLNAYLADEANPPTGVGSLSDVIAFNEQHPDRVQYGQNLLELSDAQSGLAVDPVSVASAAAATLASQQWIDQVLAQYGLTAIAAPNSGQANLAAAAGYPNVVVPTGMQSSNPQGLSLIASADQDGLLLSLAFDYEDATHLRVPPTMVNDQVGYCAAGVDAREAFTVVAESDF